MSGFGSLCSVKDRIARMGTGRKVLALLLLTAFVYGAACTFIWYGSDEVYDTDLYSSRAQTIIDGGLLYRDVHTETPPLINYMFVPAQLAGAGEMPWIWAAYESMFAFLLGSMVYLGARKWGEWESFLAGALTVLCPFLIVETSTGEDAAIVAFMFFAAAVAMLHGSKYSPIVIALGVWTKMWPVLLFPIEFLRAKGTKNKAIVMILVIGVTALVTVPFLLLCFDQFIDFLSFYFLGDPNRPSGGRSMWNFLRDGGIGLPEALELVLVLGSLAVSYLYAHFKNWHPWKAATLAMLAFIVFYPKMHLGYYVMPFVLLSFWAVSDRKVLLRIFLAYVPITLSGNFASDNSNALLTSSDGGWAVGLALVLIGTALLCDAARVAFKSECFVTRGEEVPRP